MPPVVIAAGVLGAGAVASSAIQSGAASKAAKQQRQAQQQQIQTTQSIAEQDRLERERIAKQQRVASEAALAKEEAARAQAIEQKREAFAAVKISPFAETLGPEVATGLRERIAGRAGQISPLDTDRLTAPFAARERAAFREQVVPAIGSAASARGLGRSTIPVAQIGQAAQATERGIASRGAEFDVLNKEIEARNIQSRDSALSQLQNLTNTQIALDEDIARFERQGLFEIADDTRQDAAAISSEIRGLENQIAGLERDIATKQANFQLSIAQLTAQQGIDAAANRLLQGQILAQGILGAAKGFTQFTRQDLTDTLAESEQERRGATVQVGNISGRDVGVNSFRGGSGFNFGGFRNRVF